MSCLNLKQEKTLNLIELEYLDQTMKILTMINDLSHSILFNLFQLTAIFLNIFKVDCGDCVVTSWLQHAASQAPLLDVREELQDLSRLVTANTILAT